MAQPQGRGDHPFVPPCDGEQRDPPFEKSVSSAEREEVDRRRLWIKNNGGERARDRTKSPYTGLALSGGGIRSASFALGAIQALHARCGIEGIDYLSTVSGGGYTGCALTNGLRKNGVFPFTEPRDYNDTPAVHHIRNYSNYLIPRGALDAVTAIGIIGRGLVSNILILFPVLFFLVGLTLLVFPTRDSLSDPKFLLFDLGGVFTFAADWLRANGFPIQAPYLGLKGFWLTAILIFVNLAFLVLWAFAKSISTLSLWRNSFARQRMPGDSAELNGGFVRVSKILFFVTITVAWLELQPFILKAILLVPDKTQGCEGFALSPECLGVALKGWFTQITPYLAPIGAILAFFSKFFGDIVQQAARTPGWIAWLKKISAKAALWFAAIIVPSFLWLIYLLLTSTALVHEVAYWPFFAAFLTTFFLAAFINPNATSLHRLYRDRLSKTFLFNPDRELRDKNNDLVPEEPKLSEIDTAKCPYPIVNAALNIQGSRYANKRGRNADFFVFTPEYTGSDATGYIGTARIEKEEPALDLGTAMAISGAAVSSNMGAQTVRGLTFTLAFLNLRLGYWLRNPRSVEARSFWGRLRDIRSFLLFKEMFSLITEKSPTVFLSDGGHLENLGIYSLMKRQCKLIIAIDAEADPNMTFASFLALERYARIDFGVTVALPWDEIRRHALKINEAFARAEQDGTAIPNEPGPHCAAAEFKYGPNDSDDSPVLLYVKASVSGDEADYILDYKRRHRDFPHETTGDQFFSEEQLEVYRALGFHIVKGLFDGKVPFAVTPRENETQDHARERILAKVKSFMCYEDTVSSLVRSK